MFYEFILNTYIVIIPPSHNIKYKVVAKIITTS